MLLELAGAVLSAAAGAMEAAMALVVTHDEKIFDRFVRLVSLRDGGIDANPGALVPHSD
ncbi:MAG: hypothetical protein IT340_17100 [Chloroflexi bacterium]|nr:hypothetical protein [Chloroflexota bacterium]